MDIGGFILFKIIKYIFIAMFPNIDKADYTFLTKDALNYINTSNQIMNMLGWINAFLPLDAIIFIIAATSFWYALSWTLKLIKIVLDFIKLK